ncbi:maleylpyruvate isomerase family mycothiol-dependent enzyme [Actinoplanes bogorensis]|uniref:Maleylpyruvate isomerase family mycothiol-dependent enzyme n=1 Tax=Paractinoplanes bogorensis TaxID=1610840 RepID=A0ABS5Z100_9ACTN|nr:maleylpyruvate isomerase family mycothiol-dependent enzyme [Actinoplanes bogorensis]MBU2669357.1 maleylpyruvate isomerase family mycothiol-dependent enzyme [Actinoplanes bogorensis]
MSELKPDQARRAIVEHTRWLAGSAAQAGPDAAVPTAPDWTVRQLVEHLGQTQHWVAEMAERQITDPTQLPTEVVALPADPGEWAAWLDRSARRVVAALADEVPLWNAAGDGRTGVEFWRSSMLNEAVVHGFDGENAAGRPPGVDPDVAAALITNHFRMLTSPTWAMQVPKSAEALRGSGQTLLWRATDSGDAWFVERGPDGATWQPGVRTADATVSGPAGSLLLILTRRLPLTGETGDVSVVRHWLDNTAHVAG